jgi:trans-aconitate methyltransferase
MKHAFANPSEYKQHSNLQYVFAHELVKDAGLKPTDRILDIGCGDGKITSDMGKMVPSGQVLGTDISNEMIQSATKEHTSTPQTNIGFMVMDAEKNIFRNQFDIVTSFCCLHWVKEQRQALIGIKNALVPTGKAILLVPLRHEELYTAIESVVSEKKWCNFFKGFSNPHVFFTKEKYSTLLNSAGLEKQTMQEKIMSYEFDTKRNMELFLKAWLPHMKLIPESKHDDFLSDISNTFLRIVPPHNNKIIMPLKMLKVHATRPKLSLQSIHSLTDYRNTLFSNNHLPISCAEKIVHAPLRSRL